MTSELTTPVALMIFNRPDTTARVFAEIARARPSRLMVVADGPRSEDEAKKCEETRAIIKQVDWDCEVLTNFSDTNLNCKRRFTSGLNWVFENCEEAIILEDDCLPDPSFFRYCTELLEKYRDDRRIMTISGDNFQLGQKRGDASYYFSCYHHTWGWATWKRAWQHFDPDAGRWPLLREDGWLEAVLGDRDAVQYWRSTLDRVFSGAADDVWDYQWSVACWAQNGLAILPGVNLISNIGWGADATHTQEATNSLNMPTREMEFPLRHPALILPNREADSFTLQRSFLWYGVEPTFYRRLHRQFSALLPPQLRGWRSARKLLRN